MFGILLFSILNLLFTYSRTCWVWAAVIAFGVMVNNMRKKSTLLFLGVSLVGLYYASDIIIGRLLNLSSSGTSSADIRQSVTLTMFKYSFQKPFVGHGLGNFREGALLHMNRAIEAHNEYLKTFYDSGLIGLLGLVTYFYFLLQRFIKRGIKQNYVLVFFIVGFYCACFLTNTLSCLVGQVYLLTLITMRLALVENGMLDDTAQKGAQNRL